MRFRNYYQCSKCEHEWVDEYDCQVDDRCTKCNTSTSPHISEDLCVWKELTDKPISL
jgi:hypothetical protein